jgi:geranylgeranyl diphosphate synthase, type II
MDMNIYLKQRASLIDKKIISYLPKGTKYTTDLYKAMKYALMTGGKRIRPVLVMAAAEAVSGSFKKAIPVACAVEMIHTYTLIHDDLPSMDDDDMRRGKPTVHKVFGEDIAILAGDALNTLAFEVIARNYSKEAGRLSYELANALGINGVVGGQVADIRAIGRKIGRKELEFISIYKTAYLFIACIRCGAIAAGASKAELFRLTSFAKHVGLAFQIIDDILDYKTGDKNNYPAVLGLEGARKAAEKELKTALNALPEKSPYNKLKEIALLLAKRKV